MKSRLPAFLLLGIVVGWLQAESLQAGDVLAPISNDPLCLIPEPLDVRKTSGNFELTATTKILVSTPQLRPLAVRLSRCLAVPSGFDLSVVGASSAEAGSSSIHLTLLPMDDGLLGREGYRLVVKPGDVEIEANTLAGIFYATQTMLQLMPPEIESPHRIDGVKWTIGGASIVDRPRFEWRGLMLDVSRHFFGKEVIEAYLDQMAKYKLNVFHWHLTDSPGWRIEIKSLPRLTEVGAWRAARIQGYKLSDRAYPDPDLGDIPRYGGYYTQEDVREIIDYARERFITIVPEIDMPGHSYALIASYPELSCSGQPARDPVAAVYDTLCPGNEAVFAALDKIIGEVAAIFPGEYIHVGGDEVHTDNWKACHKCRARMQEEHLTDVAQLQGYFMRRVEKIVESHGKRLIGWDEILDCGLPAKAAAMCWRKTGWQDRGVAATRAGHPVVMTPSSSCYLNFPQGNQSMEPSDIPMGKHAALRLKECYEFEPVPEGVNSTLVLGGQGNLWTEWVTNPRHVFYMTWPRAMALAEVFWSPRSGRSWESFAQRLEPQFARFDARQVKYSRSAYQPMARLEEVGGEPRIILATEIPGLDLFYSFDGSDPDPFYPRYEEPLRVQVGAEQLRVASYRGAIAIGGELKVNLTELTNSTGGRPVAPSSATR
jgi:hexosaminidase